MHEEQNNLFSLSRPSRPPKYPPMTQENRAAQFAPFSALTGLDDALEDTSFALLSILSYVKCIWENGLMRLKESTIVQQQLTFE